MFVDLVKRLRPLRGLPVWVRYLLTALIVFVCFVARYALGTIEDSEHLPLFLMFVPSVIFAAFLFDRGSGFLAVALSSVLGVYFFVTPEDAFALRNIGEVIRLATFIVTGLLTAGIIEALRTTVDQLHSTLDALARAEERSRLNLSLMNDIMEGTPDSIFVKDREGRYIHANEATARTFGMPKDQVIGRVDSELMRRSEDADRVMRTDREVMETGRTFVLEEQLPGPEGALRTYLTTKSPWYGGGDEVVGVIGVARDIQERKLIEERLKTTNAQKQLLLNDINHRVKNHLQTIAALLYAGRQKAVEDRSREALDSAISQLQVLARVYDRLQLEERATRVDAADFIQALAADLRTTMLARGQIVIRCNAATYPLDSSHAVLLGLAINELVTNAVKYAFPDGREGEIEISFATLPTVLRLEVADNGIGMRADSNSGRGKRLVLSFARELGGAAEWVSDDTGTRASICMPREH